jgi:rare lipoprotein A
MKYVYLLLILLLSQCAAVNIVPLAIEDSNKNKNISLIEKYIEDPYQVDGKWFYPRDYKSFLEVGIAEIEIELNNGDLTTNKEFFHNEVLSGSHRSLPLPSILEVTNLENGRKTKVRVNNRGAYSSTHIISLSTGVFKELNLNSGGGLVKIELINTNESFILSETQTFEEEKRVVEAPISDVVVIDAGIPNSEIVTNVSDIQTIEKRQYNEIYLNIATFSFLENAKIVLDGLSNFKAKVYNMTTNEGAQIFRVLVGPYKDVNKLINDLKDDTFKKYEDLSIFLI